VAVLVMMSTAKKVEQKYPKIFYSREVQHKTNKRQKEASKGEITCCCKELQPCFPSPRDLLQTCALGLKGRGLDRDVLRDIEKGSLGRQNVTRGCRSNFLSTNWMGRSLVETKEPCRYGKEDTQSSIRFKRQKDKRTTKGFSLLRYLHTRLSNL
jgi:hypothetical protein